MPCRRLACIALIAILLVTTATAAAAPPAPSASFWQAKVDSWVLQTGAQGQTEFLVFLADQADVTAAANLPTKAERGQFVYRTLRSRAELTQGSLRQKLQQLGVAYQSFWVANMIWVRAGSDVVQALALRPDVAHIYANPAVKLDVVADAAAAQAAAPAGASAVEWNLARVNAPQLWSAGIKGQGVVIGGQDTGYYWEHNALKGKYRGWNGTSADHNYNWHDAIHSSNSRCPADSPAPCDDYGHGTHTMGTMVGDDGAGNQIGMAPGARWIGCRNMNGGIGTPTTYAECYQWFLAPTDLNDRNPDPSLAPDVINNSWGCPPSEGCTDPGVLLAVVRSVTAAGIVTVHSAGNSGSACGTVSQPAAIYDESFTVGAMDSSDTITGFSSRGPVTVDGSGRMKPDVSAPGSFIRSSYYSGPTAYAIMDGTSMAAPHVAGLVALLISANPSLRGQVDTIRSLIEQSAVPRTTAQGCGGDLPAAVPNNVYGWGRIDALAAVGCAPTAIADLAIEKLNDTDIRLTWTAKTGVTTYNVWWKNDPFFIPGATCTADSCTPVTTTSFTQSILGDARANYTYLVQPVTTCTVLSPPLSNQVGEFEFELARGTQ